MSNFTLPKIYKGYKVEKTSISTKKEPITAFDVSEDEHIAIIFSDETIGIYDKQMNYASAYKFDTEGEFSGILWKGNNLLLFKARSDYGVEIDAEGELVNVYKEDPVYDDVLWDEYVLSKKRVVNNNKYIITNNKTKPSIIDKVKGINCSFLMKEVNGEYSILYNAKEGISAKAIGVVVIIVVLLGFVAIVLYLRIKRKQNNM